MTRNTSVMLIASPAPNQIALAHRIGSALCAIAIVEKTSRQTQMKRITNRIKRIGSLPFDRAWQAMQRSYRERYGSFPDCEQVRCASANDADVVELARKIRPAVIAVSGTDIVRKAQLQKLTEIAPVLNLHTGLSPYVKGGPNCTNWCYYMARPDLIGNTIMVIDPGVDTGDLIATEKVECAKEPGLTAIHLKVMDAAHRLYADAIGKVAAGHMLTPVKQDGLGTGRTFRMREWSGVKPAIAYWNYLTGKSQSADQAIEVSSRRTLRDPDQ